MLKTGDVRNVTLYIHLFFFFITFAWRAPKNIQREHPVFSKVINLILPQSHDVVEGLLRVANHGGRGRAQCAVHVNRARVVTSQPPADALDIRTPRDALDVVTTGDALDTRTPRDVLGGVGAVIITTLALGFR
jgi:hypothetical protein